LVFAAGAKEAEFQHGATSGGAFLTNAIDLARASGDNDVADT
jgi:hypothetical protein